MLKNPNLFIKDTCKDVPRLPELAIKTPRMCVTVEFWGVLPFCGVGGGGYLHHGLRSIKNSNAATAACMPPKCKRLILFLAFHSAVVSLLAKSTQKQSKQ